jgi:hypothetical protein
VQTESSTVIEEQRAEIQAAVAELKRPATLPAAAFFLGFAGVGEQRLFADEIKLAERVFADKFHTAERSLRLVNDQSQPRQFPIASAATLRAALAAIAARMDTATDVLFLVVSSHGDKQGFLHVSRPGMSLASLSVHELADALRDSAITWKVVIISACYSGQFLTPLIDSHTIVITAAAPDRASFGCAEDRELTYFGEAFYRDALPHAATLREAFAATRTAIAAREAREQRRPSNPQSWFGWAIVEHLENMSLE